MKVISLSHPYSILSGTIQLPASKSISNRALMLKEILANTQIELSNLSAADDTQLMLAALEQKQGTIQLKNAGTCMRFLTAFFASTPEIRVDLLCDERMEQRPIDELVNALRILGADIVYLKNEGFPPLRIQGKKLSTKPITISASCSSQFVSALMLIAPQINGGLSLTIEDNLTSLPYIQMTAKLMKQFGLQVNVNLPRINIDEYLPQSYNLQSSTHYVVEPDWSAASYFYQLVALSKQAEIELAGLSLESLQGDKKINEYMIHLGVETRTTATGILIRKSDFTSEQTTIPIIHLMHEPDLAPALIVTAAALNKQVEFTGLQNLVIKESNRLDAIYTELTQLGFCLHKTHASLEIRPLTKVEFELVVNKAHQPVKTYNDHRLAMAFAPLALVVKSIDIINPNVVEKSYPAFWDELKKIGFVINE